MSSHAMKRFAGLRVTTNLRSSRRRSSSVEVELGFRSLERINEGLVGNGDHLAAHLYGSVLSGDFLNVPFIPFGADRSMRTCGDLDLIQLDRKIKNNELKQLTVRRDEIVAMDCAGRCEYHAWVSNESTREEILREARELDANGVQRVPKIDEQSSQPEVSPVFPIGFVALFAAHIFTIFLIMGLMPLYIVLAVKSDQHDQTMRIIWVVLICMMGMLAMPVYWYLYIWRAPPVKVAGEGTGLPADNTSGTS